MRTSLWPADAARRRRWRRAAATGGPSIRWLVASHQVAAEMDDSMMRKWDNIILAIRVS